MAKKLTTLFAAMAAACLTGCGTICNFANSAADPQLQPRVYGGVLWDMEVMDGDRQMPSLGIHLNPDPRAVALVGALLVAEPVASFTADTLTLPITIGIQTARDLARTNGGGKQPTEVPAEAGPLTSPAPAPPVTSVTPAK